MKIKLYKGPMHGKSYMGQDDQTEIIISKMKPLQFGLTATMYGPNSLTYSPLPVTYDHFRYRAVRMIDSAGNKCYATHPDGSTFFEYVP